MIPEKGDLHDYWRVISTDGDLLGPPPSYTLIRDPVLRLFHQMMAHSIARRSQAPEKSGAHISGGKFVARLAEHFGLLTVEPELPIIDMERQPDAMAGAHEVAQNAPIVDEGSQADPTPVQAPPPPLAIVRTTPQRMARLVEDICEIRGALAEQHEVIDAMAHDFSRFSTWAVTSLTRMMERVGVSYVLYSKTHVPY
ncbi:hypothetical protein Tco_0551523 [Tanacetum coccineum]